MARKKSNSAGDGNRQEAKAPEKPKKQKHPAKDALVNSSSAKLYKDSHFSKSDKDPKPSKTSSKKYGEGYTFDYSTEKGSQRYKILRDVVSDYDGKNHTGMSAEYTRRLKEEGLTYRKQDMQADIRRSLAVEHAKDADAAERSHDWVTNFYEPARKYLREQGLASDPKSVNAYIQLWKKGSSKVNKEADKQLTDFWKSMDLAGKTP